MIDDGQFLNDRHLETTTAMSCKREPACFAFLGAHAALAPMAIERLNFDIASADCHGGNPTVWGTLDMRAEDSETRIFTLLGFDEGFLRPFTRAVLEAAATRIPHRMTIVPEPSRPMAPRVVDYIRSEGGARLREIIIAPYDQVLAVSAAAEAGSGEETLFQLPRTDSFLRMFTRMTHVTDRALRDTLDDMARLARLRTA